MIIYFANIVFSRKIAIFEQEKFNLKSKYYVQRF